MSAIPAIPLAAGVSRVVKGVRVEHVCGDPRLSEENDYRVARRIVTTALQALESDVVNPTLFEQPGT